MNENFFAQFYTTGHFNHTNNCIQTIIIIEKRHWSLTLVHRVRLWPRRGPGLPLGQRGREERRDCSQPLVSSPPPPLSASAPVSPSSQWGPLFSVPPLRGKKRKEGWLDGNDNTHTNTHTAMTVT